MREDTEGWRAAAERLAGGAPPWDVLVGDGPGAWSALDAAVRKMPWYQSQRTPEWLRSIPPGADLAQVGESGLALALCHRDGRIREQAVRWSSRYPGLLPLIVIRCADWARPVRERARALLREVLDADNAVGLAPLILRIGRRDRGEFGVTLLEEVLRRTPGGLFAALFADPDRSVRRFAYRLAVEWRLLSPAELALAAARDQDTVVQDLCAAAAFNTLPDVDVDVDEDGDAGRDLYDAVLTPLLTARSPRVRSVGVTALRGRGGRSRRRRSSATGPRWCAPAPGTSYGSTEATRRPGTGNGSQHRTTPSCCPARSSDWPSAETALTPGCCGPSSRTRPPVYGPWPWRGSALWTPR